MIVVSARNNVPLVRQFATGSAALMLAEQLTEIERMHAEEKRKAQERFSEEVHTINDRYLGQMKGAIRTFNNAIDDLDFGDSDSIDDDL